MTDGRGLGGTTGTQRHRLGSAALVALAAVLGVAQGAAALTLTGGPVYTLPGGGTCVASGTPSLGSGATITCSGVNLAAHSNVYFGIRNDTNANGNTMTGASPTGGAVFSFVSGSGATINYASATTVNNVPVGSQSVTNALVLTRTGGATTLVATGGNPADTGNGAIQRLFHLDSGSSFTFTAVINSTSPSFSGVANPGVYDVTQTPATGASDFAKLDLAFYYSDCGDGVTDSPTEQCDLGGSNGSATSCCTSTCQFRGSGQVCRASVGVCDLADTCTGASATCPADGKSTALCRAAATTCDAAEFCDGAGNNCPADTFASSSTVCRASGGACDIAENCTGSSPTCPADAKSSAQCRASGGVCDPAEVCDGVGDNCPTDAKSTSLCRASGGVCDVAEFCDGLNNNCPTDAKSSSQCRASVGVCDVAEVCDGVGNNCPADAKSTAQCRAAAGGCDIAEVCDGAGDNCPADTIASAGAECRSAAGACDVAEQCDGVSTVCPPDDFVAGGTECRAVAGVCDVAETCTGSGPNCPADDFLPSSTVCRASSVGETCDIPENCTGSSADCPADAVEPSSTVCRSSAGDCDVVENCDGVNRTCPADVVEPSSTVCRAASTGETCDSTETCDGVNPACPADAVLPNGTTCRASAGVCDAADACDGVSKVCPNDGKSTAQCRASAGACDVAEICDGVGNDCPADALQPDGTNCDDTNFCNGTQTCTAGVCGGGTTPCGVGQSCDEGTASCFSGSCPINAVTCRTAAKNKVLIKNKTDDTKDKLIWKWTKGAQTSTADFGDPTTTADYALCFYDGPTGGLIQQAAIPASASKWSTIGTKGFKYKDAAGAEDGITKIIVKGGAAGKSKALVKGKGLNLPDFDSDLPIATGDLPLVVQLRNNSNGICWEGSFASPKKNQLDQFNAKNP